VSEQTQDMENEIQAPPVEVTIESLKQFRENLERSIQQKLDESQRATQKSIDDALKSSGYIKQDEVDEAIKSALVEYPNYDATKQIVHAAVDGMESQMKEIDAQLKVLNKNLDQWLEIRTVAIGNADDIRELKAGHNDQEKALAKLDAERAMMVANFKALNLTISKENGVLDQLRETRASVNNNTRTLDNLTNNVTAIIDYVAQAKAAKARRQLFYDNLWSVVKNWKAWVIPGGGAIGVVIAEILRLLGNTK